MNVINHAVSHSLRFVFAFLFSCCCVWAADPPNAKPENQRDEITEQTIYIPYTKLRETFEQKGRGVFLPYEEFQKLWQAARETTRPTPPEGPPVRTIISEVDNQATVSEDVVQVHAVVSIELLAEGWLEIPLHLSDAAITHATVNEKPARLLFDADSGYKLLVEKKGKQAETLKLYLDFAKAYTKEPGQNHISFEAPQAPVSRWQFTIAEPGVKVDIQPLLAATEVPIGTVGPDSKDKTEVLAFVGAAPQVKIGWTLRAEGATGLQALVKVHSQQMVWIDDGVVRTRAQLNYQISRASLDHLFIQVPADHKIVNVFENNVRQWTVADTETGQRIEIQLFDPARQSQSITVETEKYTTDEEMHDLTIPDIQALEVSQQQGNLVVQVSSELRAEVSKRTHLMQIDITDLPPTLIDTPWTFAYRYSTTPVELGLRVEKVQPHLAAESFLTAVLKPDQLVLNLLVRYDIDKAGVFRLEYEIPADFQCSVSGRDWEKVQAAQIDSYHIEDGSPRRLIVDLSRKAFGSVGLQITLFKWLDDPNLKAPTGQASTLVLMLPRVALRSVSRVQGRIVVYAPESLNINAGSPRGLRSISFQEALEGLEEQSRQTPSGTRPVLAYAFGYDPAQLDFIVERGSMPCSVGI